MVHIEEAPQVASSSTGQIATETPVAVAPGAMQGVAASVENNPLTEFTSSVATASTAQIETELPNFPYPVAEPTALSPVSYTADWEAIEVSTTSHSVDPETEDTRSVEARTISTAAQTVYSEAAGAVVESLRPLVQMMVEEELTKQRD